MSKFFNPDNWLWRGFGRLADYFLLSICWMVCCIPIVTAGSACIALYDTVAHCFRLGEGSMIRRFFGTFRKELLRGVGLTALWAVICWLLNAGYQILTQLAETGNGWTIFSLVYFITLFIPLGVICWLVAIESRFVHSFGQLHKMAFLFTFSYLPSTIAIVALLVLALNVVLNFPFFLMVLPAVAAHLQSIFIERIFRKYMPDEA